ncbi:putative ferredoxin (plasmid) [Selenomonas ruminantium subsp. lactilytica TAM6421]|uniref:Putative ferredoxin n=1 Tax=Selenomonas ruminantium subsp. lactilytica (strain NBRC 103574 / TAM6421) TaxID=927704 RepID=I0GWD2_SELRL|nr:4Fe-4S binding protein [Selenomonas ruminantium]BAL85069.1 putative ferredoxin [Selenomonas ruminantium subsp. lactilytica TAM6421]
MNMRNKRHAVVQAADCVACGTCVDVCPRGAVQIIRGCYAQVEAGLCVGCGRCARECPASVITLEVGA